MTFTREVSECRAPANESSSELAQARLLVSRGEFETAEELVAALCANDVPEAFYLRSCFSMPSEDYAAFERRHLSDLQRAANADFAPAIHALATYYETGELVAQDVRMATQLFQRAALLGHPQSQWRIGVQLLYGAGVLERNTAGGLALVSAAADAGFRGALETMAKLHDTGAFGVEENPSRAQDLREQAARPDALDY